MVVCRGCVACGWIFRENSGRPTIEKIYRLHVWLKFLICAQIIRPRIVTLFWWCLEHRSERHQKNVLVNDAVYCGCRYLISVGECNLRPRLGSPIHLAKGKGEGIQATPDCSDDTNCAYCRFFAFLSSKKDARKKLVSLMMPASS